MRRLVCVRGKGWTCDRLGEESRASDAEMEDGNMTSEWRNKAVLRERRREGGRDDQEPKRQPRFQAPTLACCTV